MLEEGRAEIMMEQAVDDLNITAKDDSKVGEGLNEKPSRSTSPGSWVTIGGFLLLLAVIGVAIGVPLGKDNRNEPIPSESDKPEPNITITKPNNESNVVEIKGPFSATLSLYNENIVQGYQSVDEFKEDLGNVTAFFLNNVIFRNTGVKGFENIGVGRSFLVTPEIVDDLDSPELSDPEPVAAPGVSADGDQGRDSDVDDYGTNNQEANVEQGDAAVSDGEFVFAAYGDYIVIWQARTGQQVLEFKLPGVRVDSSNTVIDPQPSVGDPEVFLPESDIMEPGYFYVRPYIEKLLLHDEKLVVIVSGYSSIMQETLEYDYPLLSEYLATRISVYDTVDLMAGTPSLGFVREEDVNGRFVSARAINGNVHVVTTSNVNTFGVVNMLERYRFPEADDDTYVTQATEVGLGEVIPQFVERLTSELMVGGSFPKLFKLSLFQGDTSGTSLDQLLYGEGLINTAMLVHSFDVQNIGAKLVENIAGAFVPSFWAQVYASADILLLAGQGWHYDPDTFTSYESTYLTSFVLNEATALPHAVGEVRGNVLNSYAIDVVPDETLGFVLRLATTINNFWSIALEDGIDTFEETSRTENYITTFSLTNGINDEAGTIQELSSIDLGKPNEVFTGLRFIENRAYAVTFERIDPLYIIDVTDPENLVELGSIDNITGFTNYFEPLNDGDLNFFLGIGQEADNSGRVIGLQISVFNFTDESNPFLVDRAVLSQEPTQYSGSDALWNFESIRYNSQIGILSIPVYIRDWQNPENNFNGFILYNISPSGVSEHCRISHGVAEQNAESCYYCASLQPRSMIFDGNLTTMSSHFVRSTDIDNCVPDWSFDIVINDPLHPEFCCRYFY